MVRRYYFLLFLRNKHGKNAGAKMVYVLTRKTVQRRARTKLGCQQFGREKVSADIYDPRSIRTCISYFHSSLVKSDSRGQGRLKVGSDSSIFMNKFGMENDQCVEEKALSFIVGSIEDMKSI